MPKCSKCGTEIIDGNNFCSRCGNKAETQKNEQPQQKQTQNESQPQLATPSSSATASKKKMSTGSKVLIGCLISFVVVSILGGVLAYVLVKKGIDVAQDEIKKAEEEWSDEMEGLKELEEKSNEIKKDAEKLKDDTESGLSKTPSTETKKEEPDQKASEVVKEFMACTLGTISWKCPSENKDSIARDHLTISMRADYNNEGFVPVTYCIQNGPDDVKIFSETESSGFSYVTVSAKYGTDGFTPFWNFTLIQQDNEWKIKDITCLNY